MPRERFYSNISWDRKVRRTAGSRSFRKTGEGKYSIIQNGETVKFKTKVTQPHADEFGILFTNEKNHYPVGYFIVHFEKGKYTLWDREVEKPFRGHNIGKLGFRLAEQEVMRRGGKSLSLSTNQKNVVATALSLGYSIQGEEKASRKALIEYYQNPSTPYELLNRITLTRSLEKTGK